MARRRIPPMPVEALLDHPVRMSLPSAARGMLDDLLFHFWRTECRPLPKDDASLFAISHAHRPTWVHHRKDILKIFHEIAPEMERWRTWRDASLAPLTAAREARQAAARAHRLGNRDTVVTPRLGAQSRQKRAESRLNALESIAADVDKRFAD